MAWGVARRRSGTVGDVRGRLESRGEDSGAWLRLGAMIRHFFGKYRPEKRYMRGSGADRA